MRRALVVVATAAALCGCASVDGDPVPTEPTVAARTTLTDPSLQPPSQSNTNGRPDVAYDPCTWIPDHVIESVGYDPATRRRDDLPAEWTLFGCFVEGPGKQLLLVSDNFPFEERIGRYRESITETLTINGRTAVLFPDPDEPDTCNVIMKTVVGAVLVARTILADRETPCAGMVEFASAFEPTIGEEN